MRLLRPWRPYFFEIFLLLHLGILHTTTYVAGIDVGVGRIWMSLRGLLPSYVAVTVVGVIGRIVFALVRNDRRYLQRLRSGAWVLLTARLVLAAALTMHFYSWLKLLVPVLHPVSFDRELWEIDRALFFGYSPNVLFLEIFRIPWFLRFIDWTYVGLYFIPMALVTAFFFSHPSQRIRVSYITAWVILWTFGAWLYLLIPSMGPAYRFPDVWREVAQWFPVTRASQYALLKNYFEVLKLGRGEPALIRLLFGIAAFPSLHLGFQMFAALWVRKFSRAFTLLFDLLVVLILFGSVITGWHYLIDGLAGIALAIVAYRIALRIAPLKSSERRRPAKHARE